MKENKGIKKSFFHTNLKIGHEVSLCFTLRLFFVEFILSLTNYNNLINNLIRMQLRKKVN